MLTVLLSSPRVAPGLLSWQAWSALRAADLVLAGSGDHPQIPALAEAGVTVSLIAEYSSLPLSTGSSVAGARREERAQPPDAATLAGVLAAAGAEAGRVVWLAPPGAGLDPALAGVLTAADEVRSGAPDLPGAHLLDLVPIMDTLRVSCPWDREQTHESLLRYLLEEAYEAAETIEDGDLAGLREEIGDVMFQAFFHARIAAERLPADGGFTIDDVADTLAAKLIRRHPHVFGSVSVSSAADVNANWEEIKQAERAAKAAGSGTGQAAPSALDGVPFGQPALSLAAQLQRRALRAGIVGPGDLPSAPAGAGPDAAGLGDALMALVARARAEGLDPELELRAAARRFADSVREHERLAAATDE